MARPSYTACLIASILVGPAAVAAQVPGPTVAFSLEPQPLDRALTEIGRLTGREIIVASDAARGKTSPRLSGQMNADEAVRRLLVGSGLVAEFRDAAILVHEPVSSDPTDALSDDIVVTGSRIRGAVSPSPVHVVTAAEMRDAGQADLGDVARTLPESFGGGQNPEVGNGVTGRSQNEDSASSLNLRGLGPDATLTLLNGHRLSYDGTAQSVDISAIPLAAVDRIEIVPDGASALYGSDAVGGVANVILKRDFRGLETSARVDVPTDGGGTRELYTATAGTTWGSGGGLLTADIDHSAPILAGQRDITSSLAPTTTLIRRQSHQGVIGNLHQQITSGASLEVDALYSARQAFGETPYTADGTAWDFGTTSSSKTRSFEVAPRLIIDPIPKWQITLSGLYGEDQADYTTDLFQNGNTLAHITGCLCDALVAFEASAEGPLFNLPGGAARLALGGGARRASIHYTRVSSIDFNRSRPTSYGYGELSLPAVSRQNAMPGVQQLTVDLAGRYEGYAGSGVLSPKIGLVYSPVEGVDLKGTWGRSFKAPTLYQQYSLSYLYVYNTGDVGLPNYPAGSTIGILNGGNPDLKPERAQTWSATIDLHPARWHGGRVSLSYFDIDFTNRVGTPVQSLFSALGNPDYASFIIYNPTDADIAASAARASVGLENNTGRPFDPTQLVAIVDMAYRNVTREHASGLDASVDYPIDTGNDRKLLISVNASYLTSRRTIIPTLPPIALAGTVFNPPHLRGRAGVSWSGADVTLAGFASYIGGVDDRRSSTVSRVGSQTTIDFTARYAFAPSSVLSGTQFAFSVRNLFNDLPSPIATSYVYGTPYDSTNYSAVGRVVGVELSHKW